ncbi:Hypothetical predicted protein [Xyrichtys novacula]|uniref:Secreted protein n=1 Tax=Xyrichtys novacula TaxID=13765 RepID=A0AAV1GMT5_XYRNO|nr:Hypothetical predicted protein [Xyrichtys novacula]
MSEARPEPCFILLLLSPVAPVLRHNRLISTSHFLKKPFATEKHVLMADFRSGRTQLLRSRNNPNHVNHAVPRTAVKPADSTKY